MRYGILEVDVDYFATAFLGINESKTTRAMRLVSDIPDDAQILDVRYDAFRRVVRILMAGSGPPFVKATNGMEVQVISFIYEDAPSRPK